MHFETRGIVGAAQYVGTKALAGGPLPLSYRGSQKYEVYLS